MHKLQYEASWNKALCQKDRLHIEQLFEQVQLTDIPIACTIIRTAINHRQELLITVLLHNFSDELLTFQQRTVTYTLQDEVLATHAFTIPALLVPSNTSMPWTFQFPSGSFHENWATTGATLFIHE